MENDYLVSINKLRVYRVLYRAGILPHNISKEEKELLSKSHFIVSIVNRGKKSPLEVHVGSVQSVQNQPFRRYYEISGPLKSLASSEELPPISATDDGLLKIFKQGLNIDQTGKRPSFNVSLIRRPTMSIARPLEETDMLFKNFAKQLEFRPMNFQTTKEQYVFYCTNFPLLLDRCSEDDNKNIPRKRTPSPKVRASPELKRGIQLKVRLRELDKMVNEMDEETEDIEFETELRDDVFDPTTWEWNKVVRPFFVPKPSRMSRRRRLISPDFFH